jgi:hypothetical protein
MKRFSPIFALLFSLLSLPSWAACISSGTHLTAASASSSDLQACLSIATSSTTLISIPAGTSTWTSALSFSQPSGSTSLTIQGATTMSCTGTAGSSGYACTPTNNTIIIDSVPSSGPILNIGVASGTNLMRLANITVEGGNPGSGNDKFNGIIQFNGTSTNVRVDDSHFDVTTYTSGGGSSTLQFQGCLYGVVDHNVFDQGAGVNNAVRAYNSGSCSGDTLGVGDNVWTQAADFGGSSFLFMEGNVFNGGASDDCTLGGKFVARYNMYHAETPAPTIQTHPTGGAGRERGCRAQEDYQNYMSPVSGNYVDTGIWGSSGPMRIFGNTTTSSSAGGGTGYDAFIKIIEMRQNNNTYSQGVPPAGWGYCGTNSGLSGDGSNWDGAQTSSGSPCMDAPVTSGPGDKLTGGFTFDGSGSNNVTNSATGCTSSSTCAWPRQANEHLYEWLDNFSPTPSNPTTFFANQYLGMMANSDYYLDCRAGTQSGCTSFNGTVGVGNGILSAAPATCTQGVGYWATDQGNWNNSGSGGQGELFICGSSNNWVFNYEPYPYPHPLISGSSPAATPSCTPGAGTYTSTQNVTCTTSSAGAIQCETTNGTTPATNGTTGCANGTLVTGTISISTTLTLQVVAGGTGFTDSSVFSAGYTFTLPGPTNLRSVVLF